MAEKDFGALKPAAEEETQAVAPETSTTQPTWAQAHWASIKSKARDAREYAVTRIRQAFSMFGGEAKVESADEGGASKDESSSPQ